MRGTAGRRVRRAHPGFRLSALLHALDLLQEPVRGEYNASSAGAVGVPPGELRSRVEQDELRSLPAQLAAIHLPHNSRTAPGMRALRLRVREKAISIQKTALLAHPVRPHRAGAGDISPNIHIGKLVRMDKHHARAGRAVLLFGLYHFLPGSVFQDHP